MSWPWPREASRKRLDGPGALMAGNGFAALAATWCSAKRSRRRGIWYGMTEYLRRDQTGLNCAYVAGKETSCRCCIYSTTLFSTCCMQNYTYILWRATAKPSWWSAPCFCDGHGTGVKWHGNVHMQRTWRPHWTEEGIHILQCQSHVAAQVHGRFHLSGLVLF